VLKRSILWPVLAGALVIANDISAYFVGITIGRTPLISISPKKTWYVGVVVVVKTRRRRRRRRRRGAWRNFMKVAS